ncbi:MAG: HupE/UreJ family protein [Myxococcales bacterium]|nr:HupE/UreJ family protein [Myxococcales bacterium]
MCERSFDCGARGLSGLGVHVDGRREARTDVVVRVRRAGAERPLTLLLRADQAGPLRLPSGKLPSGERRGASVAGFVVLGVKHILGGIDHVLLVLALLCWTLVRHPSSARARARELFATVSAFTVGHSITLLLGSVAWLDVAPRPAEATIALSLVIIAAEVLRDRGTAAAAARTRRPWLLAVAFGLLHGLGFAGALRELALPHDALPSALLGFNLGVELGQLAVIAAALALWLALARARAARALAPRLAAYATGITGSVLLFARLLAP